MRLFEMLQRTPDAKIAELGKKKAALERDVGRARRARAKCR
jgi:hypothetical protein